MLTLRKNATTLYVDRSTGQWILLDGEGNLWTLPASLDSPWDQRQPYYLNEETDLEQVPGHYKHMLGLPM